MPNAAQFLATDVCVRSGRGSGPARVGNVLVSGTFGAATALAATLAAMDAMLRPARTARVRARLRRAHDGRTDGTTELRAIWFTRIAREGLRMLLALGFADAVLARIEVAGNARALRGNCVYATYHTPWGRVLALWLARQSDGALLSAPRWLDRAGKAHVPCTWRGLRALVQRIRRGKSAVVTADHFGTAGSHATAASLLGREVYVSTGAARIAAAAGVPIVPVMPRYRAGKLRIEIGPGITVGETGVVAATRRVTAAFDAELRRDPSGWEQAHRFLSAAPAERR